MENKMTKGRQKIEMKMVEDEGQRMVEDEGHRLVAFSKRRSGIYKKASELSILCGVEVAIIVFSPADKPYTFATSSMQNVVDTFMNQPLHPIDDTTCLHETRRNLRTTELTTKYNTLVAQFEDRNEQEKTLKRTERARQVNGWWEQNIDELGLLEVEHMSKSVEDFQKEISQLRSTRTDASHGNHNGIH